MANIKTQQLYNAANWNDIFKSFDSLNVLIIGDVMIDAYMWGNVNRISPEAPVPIVAVSKKENRLGGAANVALNIQALGASPYLCSVIGNDGNGKVFLDLLKKQKLSSEGIIQSKKRVTTVKTRVIGNNHQMLRIDEELENDISTNETTTLLSKIKSIISSKKIDVIIFEDYDKGNITAQLIKEVVSLSKQKNIPTVVDPKKKNFMNYSGVTLFKPNLKELKEGLKQDLDANNLKALNSQVSTFLKKQHIEIGLITLSEKGVFIQAKSENKLIAAHQRDITDVSGAGDTVVSVAALCLAINLSIEKIAALSNLAGGLVCEKVGVVPIDKKQLQIEAQKIMSN
jgi:rfaE bifunctional protein kinase chain/domain